jgi:hypothetical protein
VRGLRRAVPEIDVRTSDDAGLAGLGDPEVLRIAADSWRILVSQDRRTMPAHFARFTSGAKSPGVILLREATPISTAIEEVIPPSNQKNGPTGSCGCRIKTSPLRRGPQRDRPLDSGGDSATWSSASGTIRLKSMIDPAAPNRHRSSRWSISY